PNPTPSPYTTLFRSLLLDVASAEVDIGGLKGNLTLDTGSGRVAVRDVTGDQNIDSGSGGLTLDKIKGTTLKLDSGSGGVQASDRSEEHTSELQSLAY